MMINSILTNKWFRLQTIVVLIQQTLVACGTYWMAQLAIEVSAGQLSTPMMIGLFLSLLLPGSALHFLVCLFGKKAVLAVNKKYLERFASQNYNHPKIWRNKDMRRTRFDTVCREGQDTIDASVHAFVDFFATGLNIIFNTAAVVSVTNPILGVSIAVAGALGFAIVQRSDKRISLAAAEEMEHKTRLNGFINRSWDSIVLGNSIVFKRWRERFEQIYADAAGTAIKNVKVKDYYVALAGFLTTAVVGGTVLVMAWVQQNDTALLLASFIVLPRCMQIVWHIQIMQSHWAQWKYLRQRIAQSEGVYTAIAKIDLDPFIKAENIIVRSHPGEVVPLGKLAPNIRQGQRGRYTVTGDNGSGKSTTLISLKSDFGEEAYYVPASHTLELDVDTTNKSSGELAQLTLDDALRSSCPILLLDEWDANLSLENVTKYEAILANAAINRVIIEVRHQKTMQVAAL